MTDGVLELVVSPEYGPRRKIRFEPATRGYSREIYRWTTDGWRFAGAEPIHRLELDEDV